MDTKPATPNLDPITKEPGAHPIGTAVGAAGGGMAAGAAIGTVAGPVGTVVGAAVGAVIGGLAGKRVAESIDPTAERAYWETNYKDRPYMKDGSTYDDYGPAYGMSIDTFRSQGGDASFDDVDSEFESRWPAERGLSNLEWDDVRPASRDAWDRMKGMSS